ncbi:sushi, von Willebrand factor type A, EGF and pentraxin domain-containing protein 1-like [Mercenaria mercenaria]|uniref:sushi, von Willebrand factor type A, EGF and pentraxin domain-containing protein 1-like n=1 Tax=Mercenaria mercenaria TaxID=6596 RepID=UPI00234EC3B9|nr:sushi, von Willebrand factor type A, EGF and pentraxin domain-containing protein 1-like [Mercenaria mercenaria]
MFTLERVFFIIRINAILFLSFAKHAVGNEFHFARRMKTDFHDDMAVYNFETLTGQSINGCIELCKRKKRCKFINYERRPNLCFLIGIKNEANFQIGDYLEVKPGYYFGDKNEWNMEEHEVCEQCSENGVCEIDDGRDHSKCLNSGCGPPEQKENTIVLGGMFSVGSRIEYECKKGYKPIKNVPLRSVCLENGTWSAVEVECVPCNNPKVNLARGKPTNQSSTLFGKVAGYGTSSLAVDGMWVSNMWPDDDGPYMCAHTKRDKEISWWMVNLEHIYTVSKVAILNRSDCCSERLRNLTITVGETESNMQLCATYEGPGGAGEIVNITCQTSLLGQFVRINKPGSDALQLCEVGVYC